MILLIECLAACLIFGAGIIASIFINRSMWLNDYPPAVVERFFEKNPAKTQKTRKQNLAALIIAKVIVSAVFTVLLSGLVYLAGARDFWTACLYCYIIWFSVNLFDVIVLDLGILAHWKKLRLPGTEDMDKEYTSNKAKHIRDGFFGMIIGIPVSALCGLVIRLFAG